MANNSPRKPDDSDDETSWQQAIREFPQDVAHAYNPTTLQNNAGLMYDSLKNYVGGNPAEAHVNLQPNLPPPVANDPMNQGMDPELFAKLKAQLQNR